jgi:predicted RND superfamily exporter protein
MQVYKSSKDEFSSSGPAERVGKLKWWFLVLLVLGILALLAVLFYWGGATSRQLMRLGFLPFTTSIAYAAQGAPQESFTPRVMIVTGIFIVLGLVYLVAIFKLFFSSNSSQVDTAADLVKTLTGFFVGGATSFLG